MAKNFVIKSKKDAQHVVNNFYKFANNLYCENDEVYDAICFKNSNISSPYSGVTYLFKKNNKFYTFCEGQNWRDKQAEEIENIADFIYKNRKGINNRINTTF